MKKIWMIILIFLLVISVGCTNRITEIVEPDQQVIEGYIFTYEENPKIIVLQAQWVSLQVWIHGSDDKWIEIPSTIPSNGQYVYYLASKTVNEVELWNCNGFFYKIYVLY